MGGSCVNLDVSAWTVAAADRVPAWVIVLTVAAVVGAGSAVVAVTGLARLQNQSVEALEVPVSEAGGVE